MAAETAVEGIPDMKNFCIISNSIKDSELEKAHIIRNVIEQRRMDTTVTVMDLCCENLKIPKATEGIIVLGGDGTLLSVAKKTMYCELPLIGVNLGALGYLAEVEMSSIESAVDKLLLDQFKIEERMMLAGNVCISGEETKQSCALNDVVLCRRGDLQVIGYRVTVNGLYLNNFYADGMIISTPTGSTGYNLSAGGSIVEPLARLIVLTPVCPHTLNTRSIMLSPEDRIEIEVLPPKGMKPVEVGAYFDGTSTGIMGPGDRVNVFGAKEVTRIIKLSNDGFLEILHKKMSE